ncbi:MAG: hypothetical protein ACOYMA_07905 [Bacteroidia bacterium]
MKIRTIYHAKGMKLLSVLSLFMLIIGCSKKNPCNDYTSQTFKYSLSDSTKTQIPYTGSETLTFISNQGDTVILVGQGKNNYFRNEKVKVSNNPECPEEDNYSYEQLHIEYKGNNPNLSSIFFKSYAEIYSREYTNVTLNNTYAQYKAYSDYYNDTSRYLNQVIIGNKKVAGIVIEADKSTDPFFIFNKSYGIIQIQIDSNLIYTLNL